MLQVLSPKPAGAKLDARSTAMSPRDLLESAKSLVRRRYLLIIVIFSLCVICGAIYLLVASPKYLAQAELLIETKKSQPFQQPQQMSAEPSTDSLTIDSDIQVLKSENVGLLVIKELHLTEVPEFVGSRPGFFRTLFGLGQSSDAVSESVMQQRAYGVFRNGLLPRRIPGTYIIEVGFLSTNPELAARIANATSNALITDQLEAKYQAIKTGSDWLQDRIKELREQASAAERVALDYKKAHNIVVDKEGRSITDQQVSELNTQLVVARAASADTRARLDRISEITKSDISDIDNVLRTPDPAISDALHSDIINKLRTEYLDLASRTSILEPRLGRDHLAIVSFRNQMFEIRRSIFGELKRIQESLKSDLNIALAREQSIQKALADVVAQSQSTNQEQVSLKDLDSNAQALRTIHDNFAQRYAESLQQLSFPYPEARLITHATYGAKSQPNTMLVLTLASASGLLLGFGVAFLIDLTEGGFRTTEQVERELRTNCLAVVPLVNGEPITMYADKTAPRQIELGGILNNAIATPFSRFSEAFRAIKVGIDLAALTKSSKAKTIGITSTLPNEGKSTVAANLARLIAHTGATIILVDCDLRNPSLTRALAPGAEMGLLDVLSGKNRLSETVWTDAATSLSFLPMVAQVRPSHTNEILASLEMKKLIGSLEEAYDYVLVDLPPLMPVVDVRSTTQLVDSYLFVVQWGQTSVEVVERALLSAHNVYEKLLGIVLNKADLETMRTYSGEGDSGYKNRYYQRYGFDE